MRSCSPDNRSVISICDNVTNQYCDLAGGSRKEIKIMKTAKLAIGTGLVLFAATATHAQESCFTWEGSVEIGVDSTVSSDDLTAELTNSYIEAELAFEAAITRRITLFGGLTLESVTDPLASREFDDMGLYVSELGLRFDLAPGTLTVGKISPTFAFAWDETPGFYGTSLAEDYELSEVIGASLDYPVGETGGTLSFAVFYADDTSLSNSLGTKRGRNTTSAGGAGNTGKLNNVALQWTQELGETTYWVGARHLSAGAGDVSDETGAVVGLTHDFSNGFNMIAEVAYFDSFGGAGDNATYATFGGSYGVGDWSYSASLTGINNSAASSDHLVSLGIDYAFSSGVEVGGGIGFFDVGGVKSQAIGVSVVVPFGG